MYTVGVILSHSNNYPSRNSTTNREHFAEGDGSDSAGGGDEEFGDLLAELESEDEAGSAKDEL